jgi:hypothetical protein
MSLSLVPSRASDEAHPPHPAIGFDMGITKMQRTHNQFFPR